MGQKNMRALLKMVFIMATEIWTYMMEVIILERLKKIIGMENQHFFNADGSIAKNQYNNGELFYADESFLRNGDYYSSGMNNMGDPHGEGLYIEASGNQYSEPFKNGKYHGNEHTVCEW